MSEIPLYLRSDADQPHAPHRRTRRVRCTGVARSSEPPSPPGPPQGPRHSPAAGSYGVVLSYVRGAPLVQPPFVAGMDAFLMTSTMTLFPPTAPPDLEAGPKFSNSLAHLSDSLPKPCCADPLERQCCQYILRRHSFREGGMQGYLTHEKTHPPRTLP